jgi:Family of unknown function (DUF5995)
MAILGSMSRKRRTDKKSDIDLSPVDEVIAQIQEIIDWSKENKSPIGYFAALYKRTTKAIRAAIEADRFESGPRMVRIDKIFAGRYFDAVEAYRHPKKTPTRVWQVAFQNQDGHKPLIILQHLMTAMNAHINLDLGVITATEIDAASIKSLHKDFIAINTILASQVPDVLKELDQISPAFKENRKWLKHKDADFIDAGLNGFRDNAWMFACQLAAEDDGDQPGLITSRDFVCGLLGKWYVHPLPFGQVIDAIRDEELTDVAHNIEVLDGVAEKPAALPRALW